MQKIIYADLHCDSITKCCACGGDMLDFSGQVNIRKLTASGCGAQCFALFTDGENAEEDFKKFLAFYGAQIEKHPRLQPVLRRGDVERAVENGKIGAVLTVENLGFLNGGVSGIAALKAAGVKMASLVWNSANAYAYPNLKFKDGAPDIAARESRGLTAAGRAAVEELNKNGVICDISHLSDGGAEDVFALSELPVVASHSNCAAACNVSRNLTDGQIKKIAESGGLVGLNFCRDFVVEGGVCRRTLRYGAYQKRKRVRRFVRALYPPRKRRRRGYCGYRKRFRRHTAVRRTQRLHQDLRALRIFRKARRKREVVGKVCFRQFFAFVRLNG